MNPQFWAEKMSSIPTFSSPSWGLCHVPCAWQRDQHPGHFSRKLQSLTALVNILIGSFKIAPCKSSCLLSAEQFSKCCFGKWRSFLWRFWPHPLPHCLSKLAQAREALSTDDQLLRNLRGAKMTASDTSRHSRRVLIIHNYKHFHVHTCYLLSLTPQRSDFTHCGNL